MTALSIALVLCCAMVCGTRIYLKRVAKDEALAVAESRSTSALGARVDALSERLNTEEARTAAEVLTLRAEVDSLKALSAFRGAR